MHLGIRKYTAHGSDMFIASSYPETVVPEITVEMVETTG